MTDSTTTTSNTNATTTTIAQKQCPTCRKRFPATLQNFYADNARKKLLKQGIVEPLEKRRLKSECRSCYNKSNTEATKRGNTFKKLPVDVKKYLYTKMVVDKLRPVDILKSLDTDFKDFQSGKSKLTLQQLYSIRQNNLAYMPSENESVEPSRKHRRLKVEMLNDDALEQLAADFKSMGLGQMTMAEVATKHKISVPTLARIKIEEVKH
jgi:hypothetical protein